MKTKLALVVLFIVSLWIANIFLKDNFNQKKEALFHEQQLIVENQYKTIINILQNLSMSVFKGYIDNNIIKKTFYERDRDKLFELLKNDYEYLKKFGFKQLHFHLPNSNSFLRMHQPDKFGDNLSDARYSVDYVNTYHKPKKGLEAGKVIPGYRFVYPLFLDKKYIGSVELSFGVDKIIDEIENVYDYHTHFLINKNIYAKKVFPSFQNFYMPSIEHKDYILSKRIGKVNQIETWYKNNPKIESKLEEKFKTKKIFSLVLEVDNKNNPNLYKLATFLPIKNIENTTCSYFVFYYDDPVYKSLLNQFRYNQIIMFLIIIIIFSAIYAIILYKNHLIDKTKQLKIFNEKLEKKVNEKTKSLKELNENLEERVLMEVEKNREKDLLIHEQSKLLTLTETISSIAHHWRQPLNELSIRIQKIKLKFLDGDMDEIYIDTFIEKNKQTINYLSQTIDQFRMFFKTDSKERTFNLKQVVNEALELKETQLTYFNIQINLDLEDLEIKGFKTNFLQVILNLITNAKDALVDDHIKEPKLEISLRNNQLIIFNNGKQIDKTIQSDIFKPYFTTKEKTKRNGIGLYISKIIIEKQFDGTLHFENKKNGVAFILSFPSLEENAQ